MSISIVINHTYTLFEVGLFQENKLIEAVIETSKNTSKKLLPIIDQLLKTHNLDLKNISHISVNSGPGPFTTLRSIIATINGIAFARHIPLVSVDGMKTFLLEQQTPLFPITIGVFNAFNNEIFYGIEVKSEITYIHYGNIDFVLDEIKKTYPEQTIRFIGSGVTLYKENIEKLFGEWLYIPDPNPESVSLNSVGISGFHKFKNNEDIFEQLLPQYLKQFTYPKSLLYRHHRLN